VAANMGNSPVFGASITDWRGRLAPVQMGLGGQQGNIGEPADTLPQSGTMLPGMPGYGHAVQ